MGLRGGFARLAWSAVVASLVSAGCGGRLRAPDLPRAPHRQWDVQSSVGGRSLDLHLAVPSATGAPRPLVVYASGDGGWFGAAVSMFTLAADAGYPVAGFSSRALLRTARAGGRAPTADAVAADYGAIVREATAAMGLPADTPVILTGWSRGASLAVIAAGRLHSGRVDGLVAIGLSERENLLVDDVDDDSDAGAAVTRAGGRHIDTYALVHQLRSLPVCIIEATEDAYFPADAARARLGADTARLRLVPVDARNHRFAGGEAAFAHAFTEALGWVSATGTPAAARATPDSMRTPR